MFKMETILRDNRKYTFTLSQHCKFKRVDAEGTGNPGSILRWIMLQLLKQIFLQEKNLGNKKMRPLRYNRNIVESGVKHYKPKPD